MSSSNFYVPHNRTHLSCSPRGEICGRRK